MRSCLPTLPANPALPCPATLHAGERHVTPWLTITGKRAPEVPLLQVRLIRSGPDLLRVTAQVRGGAASPSEDARGAAWPARGTQHACPMTGCMDGP